MALRKDEKANLRKRYTLYVEIGLILSLLILIGAVRLNISTGPTNEIVMEDQEVVEMEEIQQTKQEVKPPPPPRPPVPVEVPNDQVLEEENVDFDASLDFDEPLEETAPPPEEEPAEESEEPEVFMAVEQMPEPVGGMAKLQSSVEYPPFAQRAGIEGRVVIQFIVDQQGNVTEPKVIASPHELLSEEALRVVKAAKFTPGKQRGQPVPVRMSIPINFGLR